MENMSREMEILREDLTVHNSLAALTTSRDVSGMDIGSERTGRSCILLKALSLNFRPIL